MNIESHDPAFGLLLTCAVRYVLGRRTYMVTNIIEFATNLLPEIPTGTLICIERDISRANSLGDNQIDEPEWKKFQSSIQKEIRKRGC